MAGQDLLDQGGTRPWQTDDEHGPPRLEPGVCQSLEQGRLERLDQLRDEPLVLGRIVHHVSPLEAAASASALAWRAHVGRLAIAPARVPDVRQAEDKVDPSRVDRCSDRRACSSIALQSSSGSLPFKSIASRASAWLLASCVVDRRSEAGFGGGESRQSFREDCPG